MLRDLELGRDFEGPEGRLFGDGDQHRPIRITLDDPNLRELSEDDAVAFGMICDLRDHELIEILSSEPSDFPCIEIGDASPESSSTTVYVDFGENNQVHTAIWHTDQVAREARRSADQEGIEYGALLKDLMLARAHLRLQRDLLITTSSHVRQDLQARKANPLLPSEALRIIGIFLRSREDFTLMARGGRSLSSRWSFFWDLATIRLYSLSKTNFRNAELPNNCHGRVGSLQGSILRRCARGLQAQDHVIIQTLAGHDFDIVTYHFGYLLLLLSGALDALAALLREIFDLQISDRSASFRNSRFIGALGANGSDAIVACATSERFLALLELLYWPRNRIHQAELPEVCLDGDDRFLIVSEEVAKKMRMAASIVSSEAEWFRSRSRGELWLSPMHYSQVLTSSVHEYLEEFAKLLLRDHGLELREDTADEWRRWQLKRIDRMGL